MAKYKNGDKVRDEHGHVVTITGTEPLPDGNVVYLGSVDLGHIRQPDRFRESQLFPLRSGGNFFGGNDKDKAEGKPEGDGK